MNMSSFRRSMLLSSTVAAVTSLSFGQAVLAQDEEQIVEEVVVTGSRIVRKDLESASPVTVIGAEEISLAGDTRIEDLIQTLPQAFNAQNSTVANGSSGTATINLRALGSVRTLVLVNGRRLMPGDPQSPSADINNIPSALVKRVDVLTGGASSVYGADAVAGVVNFVLDTDFEGLRASAGYSTYQHNNRNQNMRDINEARGFDTPKGNIFTGGAWTYDLALGGEFADGKGHASAYLTYRSINEITKADYDFTNCTVNAYDSGPGCGGSTTIPWGRFIVPDGYQANADYNIGVPEDDDLYDDREFVVDPGSTSYWVNKDTGVFEVWDGTRFNYGPFNHIQRPDETFTAGSFINYEFNEKAEGYMEFMFMDDKTDAQIAPSGNFFRTTSINCDNPMLSAVQLDAICDSKIGSDGVSYADSGTGQVTIGRRNVEGGNRTSKMRHTNYRMVAGLRGNLNDTWSYDVYGLYATSLFSSMYINDLNTNRIKDALNVVLDVDGNMVCASGNDGCAPWNIFQQGGVTQEALDYISTVAVAKGFTKTQVVSGSVSADLGDYEISLPSATDGVQVAFGSEYRKESLAYEPDEVFSKGLRAGSGGASPPIEGGFDVFEVFGEALVPIVQGADMAQDLSLELAYRYSEYNLSGGAQTYKAQLVWAINDDIKIRAGYNRAVRAANAVELFDPQGYGLGGDDDICGGPTPSVSVSACENTGLDPALYGSVLLNPAEQYNTYGGGNPNLSPEVADTYTVGVVITPEAIDGLSMTVDWYDITVNDTIGVLGADDVINACALTGDAELCSKVHRDELGTLWLTNEGYTETFRGNIGQMRNSGIDVSVNYAFDIGNAGQIRANLIGSYLLKDHFENPLTNYDCVGYFAASCGTPKSKWRHKMRVTWDTNFDTAISLSWRYTGGVEHSGFSDEVALSTSQSNKDKWAANGVDVVGAQSYFDLAFNHTLSENVRITGGISNLFDKEPPILPSISSTGYGNTYDTRGRRLYLSAKLDF